MGRMSFTQEIRTDQKVDSAKGRPATNFEGTGSAGTIRHVHKATRNKTSDVAPYEAPPIDDSRLDMLRREKRMTVEERLALFERLMRRVAWARSAKRLR